MTLTFWIAAFPRLARDTPEIQEAAQKVKEGAMTEEEYEVADSMQRNRLSNMSLCISACGEV
jgi:hypothetical protein